MKEEETIISKLVVKEQSEFEEWILKNDSSHGKGMFKINILCK